MDKTEALIKKINIKKMSGMDTTYEDNKIFQYIEEFVSSTNNKAWHDLISTYDKEMNKQFVSRYGFIPDTLEGMFDIVNIAIDIFDNHKDDIDFLSDNLFEYCISKTWRFCMDRNYLAYPKDDEVYESTLKQLCYTETDQRLLDRAWNMIKEKNKRATISPENLLMISSGMMAFVRGCIKCEKKCCQPLS